jgi:hypothetical protein
MSSVPKERHRFGQQVSQAGVLGVLATNLIESDVEK